MGTKTPDSAQYTTLAEYRINGLRLPQTTIARKAGVRQAWISQIERGHAPRPWKRAEIVEAYQITEAEFMRMVSNAAKLNALQKPMAAETPLFAQNAFDGALNQAKQALLMQYEKNNPTEKLA